jgi:hypothetical protein
MSHVNECRSMWLADLASKDRAASPVGRGRRGEGRPKNREQTNTSVEGRRETDRQTGTFVVETGTSDRRGDGWGRVLMDQRAKKLVDRTAEQPRSGISRHGRSGEQDNMLTSSRDPSAIRTRFQRVNRPELCHSNAVNEIRSKVNIGTRTRRPWRQESRAMRRCQAGISRAARCVPNALTSRNCAMATQLTRGVQSRTHETRTRWSCCPWGSRTRLEITIHL